MGLLTLISPCTILQTNQHLSAIVVPFPELGVVVEIKHVKSTKGTEAYCFRAGRKMTSEG